MVFNAEECNLYAKGPKSMDSDSKQTGDVPIDNHIDNDIKAHKLKCSKLLEEIKKINTTLSHIKAYKMLTGQVIFMNDEGILVKKPANYFERYKA